MDNLKFTKCVSGQRLSIQDTLNSNKIAVAFNFEAAFNTFVFGLNHNAKWFNQEFLCYFDQLKSATHPDAYELEETDSKSSIFNVDLNYLSSRVGISELCFLIYPTESDLLSHLSTGQITVITDSSKDSNSVLIFECDLSNRRSFYGLIALRLCVQDNEWKIHFYDQPVEENPIEAAVSFYGAIPDAEGLVEPANNQGPSPLWFPDKEVAEDHQPVQNATPVKPPPAQKSEPPRAKKKTPPPPKPPPPKPPKGKKGKPAPPKPPKKQKVSDSGVPTKVASETVQKTAGPEVGVGNTSIPSSPLSGVDTRRFILRTDAVTLGQVQIGDNTNPLKTFVPPNMRRAEYYVLRTEDDNQELFLLSFSKS